MTEAALYKPGSGAGGGGAAAGIPTGSGSGRLLFGPEDVGTRLKVWWGKDKVFYSGTVTEWSHHEGYVSRWCRMDDGFLMA